MKNKLVFLSVILFLLLFSNTGHSQWLVDGGNIFYPYGNVSITNGNFSADTLGSNSLSSGFYLRGAMDSYLKFDNIADEYGFVELRANDYYDWYGGDASLWLSPEEGIYLSSSNYITLNGSRTRLISGSTYLEVDEDEIQLDGDTYFKPANNSLSYLKIEEYGDGGMKFDLKIDQSEFSYPSQMWMNPEEGFHIRAEDLTIIGDDYNTSQIRISGSQQFYKGFVLLEHDTVMIGSNQGLDQAYIVIDNSQKSINSVTDNHNVLARGTGQYEISYPFVYVGDLSESYSNTYMSINADTREFTFFAEDEEVFRIQYSSGAGHYTFPFMPSDSTGLNTGELFYNSSTGAVHRKF